MTEESSKKNAKKFVLKTPKGTADYSPSRIAVRDQVFKNVIETFEKHGAEQIDTPAFELKETLTGKYGEDSKLIYDLMDQGGELLSLRYDLTVPFARYLASNKIKKMKRFHIAKVYRRDNISMSKGRYREFYQCDFDIAGIYDPLLPDAEVLKVVVDILSKLEIGCFIIKLNHRKVLDGMMSVCGVPTDLIRPISSAIDKLDKISWEQVALEMKQKGLTDEAIEKIHHFVLMKGGSELLKELKSSSAAYQEDPNFKIGVDELLLLMEYVKIFKIDKFISIDLSLARGLDYYTGVIYEAVIVQYPDCLQKASKKDSEDTLSLGSIAAGGRYDDLVGMFANGPPVPCVGVSLGVERLMAIIEAIHAAKHESVRTSKTHVLVAAAPTGMLKERMELVNLLWDAGINAETKYSHKTNLKKQFEECEQKQIPFCMIIGETELKNGVVNLRSMTDKSEKSVAVDDLVKHFSLLTCH